MRKAPVAILGIAAAAGLAAAASAAETYRLVHAVGNTEKVIAKGLRLAECQQMRDERKKLVQMLGVGGSLTCLPDSIFED